MLGSTSTMKAFLIFGILACELGASLGLDCYLCMGSVDSDCNEKDNLTMIIQHCPVYEQSRNYCVAYKSIDSVQMTAGFIRGCGFMKKEDNRTVCEYLKELKMTSDCVNCENDLCNI